MAVTANPKCIVRNAVAQRESTFRTVPLFSSRSSTDNRSSFGPGPQVAATREGRGGTAGICSEHLAGRVRVAVSAVFAAVFVVSSRRVRFSWNRTRDRRRILTCFQSQSVARRGRPPTGTRSYRLVAATSASPIGRFAPSASPSGRRDGRTLGFPSCLACHRSSCPFSGGSSGACHTPRTRSANPRRTRTTCVSPVRGSGASG